MPELPISELLLFVFTVVVYIAAAIVGVFQLFSVGKNQRKILMLLICIAVLMELIILILRGIAIKAVPLTGIFESMIVLSVVFGFMYLFLSFSI